MQASFQCPNCHSTLQADTSWSGQQTQCPNCNSTLTIPNFPADTPQAQPPQGVTIKTRCPGCNQEYDVQANTIGFTCQCARCGRQFVIQNPTSDEDDEDFRASEMFEQFKKVSWKEIFPYKEVFKVKNLDNPVVRFVVFFVLFPFIASMWMYDSKISFLATIIFYFNMLWVFVFCSQLNVRKKLLLKGFGYMLFTATIGIIICYLMQMLPIVSGLYKGIDNNKIGAFFGLILGVGPVEEITKVLPLLIFGVWRKQIRSGRMGLFLGLMSGLGFAFSESIEYVDMLAQKEGVVGALEQIFFRVLCLSFLHGAWCGIIGYNLGLNIKKQTRPLWPTVVAALAVSAVLHGLYDFAVMGLKWGWLGAIIAVVSSVLFTCFASKAAGENPVGNGNVLLDNVQQP